MELIAVTIAPILRIGPNGTEGIMRFRLIVVARINADTVARSQLTVIVIEDVKTTAATALAHGMHRSRSDPIRGLRPDTGTAT
jgi:hypothetical protein